MDTNINIDIDISIEIDNINPDASTVNSVHACFKRFIWPFNFCYLFFLLFYGYLIAIAGF